MLSVYSINFVTPVTTLFWQELLARWQIFAGPPLINKTNWIKFVPISDNNVLGKCLFSEMMINIEEIDKVEEELTVSSISRHVVETENCGEMEVYVEGDLDKLRDTSTVFLTVHDVGSSYLSWVQFTRHKEVREVRKR